MKPALSVRSLLVNFVDIILTTVFEVLSHAFKSLIPETKEKINKYHILYCITLQFNIFSGKNTNFKTSDSKGKTKHQKKTFYELNLLRN